METYRKYLPTVGIVALLVLVLLFRPTGILGESLGKARA